MKSSIIRLTACAAVMLAAAATAAPVSPTALNGKSALFVVGEAKKGQPNDDGLIKEYLESRGVNVTLASAKDSAAAAQGKDLVIISSTVDARVLGDRYRTVPVPVVTWNAYSFGEMDMTGKALHKDFSVVREKVFHNANHAAYYAYSVSGTKPINQAAGLPQGIFAPLTFSAGETDPSWGKPTLAADISVYFEGDPDKAAVFSYEKGSLMAHETPAPARRVGLFLGDNSFSVLTDATGPAAQDPKSRDWFAGRKVFDAALRWAVSPPDAPAPKQDVAQFESRLASFAKGKKVLYVRRFDMPWPANEASDQAHLAWLRGLGFEVTAVDQMEPDSHAKGKDLVIVSASTNKYKIGNKYSDISAPLVVQEAKAVDSFHMVGRRRNTDYGVNDHKESLYPPENYVQLLRPAHPLSAGFPAGNFKLYKTPGVLAWSRVPPGAEVIASIPNQPEHGTFFGYEKGASMANDHIAPARRLLFPMDATRFPDLTDEGRMLYGSALMWVLSAAQGK
ncbi:hypothetical protein P3W85_43425 [Cupriavidus basilensis]|uniref:Uncharacterized protein n=1 Tax=Cupriavidus basilensis TaxID=68895 RepID=A0ABT6B5I6_9BURK|nr:hypothetical protein [Cupriavidus basilensis]MDF3839742.1 hypothetical protein [Cupriavidus basilensis]